MATFRDTMVPPLNGRVVLRADIGITESVFLGMVERPLDGSL